MNGSPRRRSPLQATLAAVLLGAVLAGSATLATRLPESNRALAEPPAGPQLGLLTSDPATGLSLSTTVLPPGTTVTGLSGTISAPATSVTSTTSTGAAATTTVPAPPPPRLTTTNRATTRTAPPPAGSPTAQVIQLVNAVRARSGCRALRENSGLDHAAQQHSTDMSQRHYFSHNTPEGLTFNLREEENGYRNPGGENIAEGQTSAQQVMTDWMNSSGHRANILNCSFVAIGVGLDTNGWYWTQDFGR